MAEFSKQIYRELIAAIAAGKRPIIAFDDNRDGGLLLRLDVDYDLGWAAETASINEALGVSATYFVQVGSPLYNPATSDGRKALETIVGANQHVGLHYHHTDGKYVDMDRMELEFRLLRELVPNCQRCLAWHNPEGDLGGINSEVVGAGFISAYDEAYFGDEIFISDSNCRHSAEEILAFAAAADVPIIQVLLHPFNWIAGGAKMTEILVNTFASKTDALLDAFEQNSVWRDGLGKEIADQIASLLWHKGK